MGSSGHIRYERVPPVRPDVSDPSSGAAGPLIGVITIDRPAKRNAMSFAVLADFIETVGEAGRDPETAVLIVTGVPGNFCAGTDLADLSTIPGETRGLRGSAEETDKWWPLVECP